MNSLIKVKIITVKSLILELDASMVTLPATDGEMGILPGHIPMLVELEAGIVKITSPSKDTKYFIYGAVAEITGEYVNILADFGIDLVTTTKNQILEEISSLELSLAKEIHEHNIAAIKANLGRQRELLKHL
jgi:F-type H+-transporting ATPase subunit epsilon